MDSDIQVAPDGVVNALCQLVESIDPRLLLEGTPSQHRRGHRPIPKNIPFLRTNIQAALKYAKGNDESLRPLLRFARKPEIAAVQTLSKSFLAHASGSLANWFGRAEFLAACWLDEREEVRKLVHCHSDEWISAPISEEDKARAKKALDEEWLRLGAGGPSARDSSDDSPQATALSNERPHTGPAQKAISEAHKKVEAQKRKFEKKLEKLQSQLEGQESQIARGRKAAEEARARAKQLQQDKDAMQQRLDAMEAEIEGRKRLAISEALSNEAWRWLSRPLSIEATNAAVEARDLPGAARALLARQQSQDRHYGNTQEIKGKIADRLALIQELEYAQATAIRPLPELVPTIAQLQDEVHKLRNLVEEHPGLTSPIARHLLARINGVASSSALSRIRSFVKEADSLALLSPDDKALVDGALDQKHERLIDPYQMHISATDADKSATSNPLRLATQSREQTVVLLDGHNVLFRMGRLFEEYFDGGQPGIRAREKLAGAVLRRFGGTRAEVALYFDGSEPGVDVLSDNIRVIYSGGSGANRADGAILAHIEERRQHNSKARYLVVTSDMELAGKARERGAKVVVSEALSDFLLDGDTQDVQ